jgi:hypothetical protein
MGVNKAPLTTVAGEPEPSLGVGALIAESTEQRGVRVHVGPAT